MFQEQVDQDEQARTALFVNDIDQNHNCAPAQLDVSAPGALCEN